MASTTRYNVVYVYGGIRYSPPADICCTPAAATRRAQRVVCMACAVSGEYLVLQYWASTALSIVVVASISPLSQLLYATTPHRVSYRVVFSALRHTQYSPLPASWLCGIAQYGNTVITYSMLYRAVEATTTLLHALRRSLAAGWRAGF